MSRVSGLMRGPSRTGDKVVLRIFEFLKAFRLISFCHWFAPDNPLACGCNAERGDLCRFFSSDLGSSKNYRAEGEFFHVGLSAISAFETARGFARHSADARGLRQSKDYVALSPLSCFRRRTLDTRKERPTRKRACPICERNRLPRLHTRRTSAPILELSQQRRDLRDALRRSEPGRFQTSKPGDKREGTGSDCHQRNDQKREVYRNPEAP